MGVAQLPDDFHNSFEKTFPASPSLRERSKPELVRSGALFPADSGGKVTPVFLAPRVPVSTSIIRFLCNAFFCLLKSSKAIFSLTKTEVTPILATQQMR